MQHRINLTIGPKTKKWLDELQAGLDKANPGFKLQQFYYTHLGTGLNDLGRRVKIKPAPASMKQ